MSNFEFSNAELYIQPVGSAVNFDFVPQAILAYSLVPGIVVSVSGKWTVPSTKGSDICVRWNARAIKQKDIFDGWNDALEKQPTVSSLWTLTDIQQMSVRVIWCKSNQKNANSRIVEWSKTTVIDPDQNAVAWDSSITPKQDAIFFSYLNVPPEKDQLHLERWDSVDLYGQTWKKEEHIKPDLYLPKPSVLNFVFNNKDLYTPAYTPEVYFQFGHVYPNRAVQPKDADLKSGYQWGRVENVVKVMPWGFGQSQYRRDPYFGISYPDYSGPVTLPGEPDAPKDKASYQIVNTVSIVKLPERTPIEMANISISRDLDSFAWSFSASVLNKSSMAIIEPDGSGAKDIEVSINGFIWVFMIERYTSTSKFPAESYQVSGSSRTQYLGAPYAPIRSKSFVSPVNATQAATDELALTGFTLIWDVATPDWTIDANVYQYQNKRPIDVIAEISAAVGAVMVPSIATDEITIQPRYKVSPWELDATPLVNIDNVVTESMTLSMSAQWQPRSDINAAYVSGIDAGRAVNVVINGTAGDVPAPDYFHALNLDDQQCREKGRNIISEGGNQSIITLEVPLPPSGSPGLIDPGGLLEYRDQAGAKQWRGLILSNKISASGTGAANVTQQTQIERHY